MTSQGSKKNTAFTMNPAQELVCSIVENGQYKTMLQITNITEKSNLAYKVKTTNPKYYVVKPNQGIVEPSKTVTIDITLLLSSEENVRDHKFLVLAGETPLSVSETFNLGIFWDKLPKSDIFKGKLRVSLGGEDQQVRETPRTETQKFEDSRQSFP